MRSIRLAAKAGVACAFAAATVACSNGTSSHGAAPSDESGGSGAVAGNGGAGLAPGVSGAAGAQGGGAGNASAGNGGGVAGGASAGSAGASGGAGTAAGVGGDSAGASGTGAGGASGSGASGASGSGSSGASGSGSSGASGSGSSGASGSGSSGASGSAGSAGSAGNPSYPPPITTHLTIGVHDPAMIHAGSKYYLLATGGLLNVRSSSNLTQWSSSGNIFSSMPSWIATELGQSITALWAPDISYFSGTYHVYYAGSTFGSNHSVIGLATNTTLDPSAAGYKWVDQGLVIESNKTGGPTDNWNAIDPNLSFDASGNAWLVFGSFWSGIKLRQIDVATGKLSTANTTLYALANNANGIEAASIVSHNGFYYLFVSYDKCCAGVNSTYRTMVGRAPAITGPYTDKSGQSMMQGHAEQMLATDGRYIGPGGGTAFQDGNLYYYAYHYYDGQANGSSFLMMQPILWGSDDWPTFGASLWQ